MIMRSKGSCKVTIMLGHADDKSPIPIGPATGDPRTDVRHNCVSSHEHRGDHYCGCAVDWDSNGRIVKAPWLTDDATKNG
jgi:hypothetical protein